MWKGLIRDSNPKKDLELYVGMACWIGGRQIGRLSAPPAEQSIGFVDASVATFVLINGVFLVLLRWGAVGCSVMN